MKSFNPKMKMKQLYMDDETFLQCTEEHLKYLREAGEATITAAEAAAAALDKNTTTTGQSGEASPVIKLNPPIKK